MVSLSRREPLTYSDTPIVHSSIRTGIMKNDAYNTPDSPNTSDTMGVPALPALENIVPNSSVPLRSGAALRHITRPTP